MLSLWYGTPSRQRIYDIELVSKKIEDTTVYTSSTVKLITAMFYFRFSSSKLLMVRMILMNERLSPTRASFFESNASNTKPVGR